MDGNKKKKGLLSSFERKLVLMILITIVISGATTYGFFYSVKTQSGENTLNTSCFDVSFEEGNSIRLANAISMSDASGQKVSPYTFTMQNTCDTEANYYVILSSKIGSFSSNFINISLNKENISTLSNNKQNNVVPVDDGYGDSYIISSGSLKKDETITLDLRVWVNSTTTYEDVAGKTWEGLVRVINTVKAVDDQKNKGFVPKAVDAILSGNPVEGINEGTPIFADPATTDEGVYAMEDDYGMSYYYRGAVTNNYVKFAGFYWRIIRINGDGSLRIIFDGTQGYANGVSNTGRLAYTKKAFNAQNNDAKYVGWMFGGAQGEASTSKVQAQTNTTNSDLKTLVDSWYKTNIVDKNLGDKVADVGFCNDRTTPGTAETGNIADTGLGYGSQYTAYGATARTNVWNTDASKVQPRFTCPQKNDAFTVSDEELGNGDLTYPVGLITADEIVAAGSGKYNTGSTANSSYYLYKGSFYWSLSPFYFAVGSAHVFYENGELYNTYIDYTNGAVAPVINLKPEYAITLKGTGTMEDPYTE